MDCSKNRLSSGVNDPDMEVGSVRARPRDVFGVSVLLTLLLAILLAMWTVGLEDPHGLSHATPVRAADVPSLEPLYGAVQTPWRSLGARSRDAGGLAWAPDGTWLATAANARFAIWGAGTGVLVRRVLNASVWGEAADWSPDGHYLAFDAVGGPSIYDAITGEPVYI